MADRQIDTFAHEIIQTKSRWCHFWFGLGTTTNRWAEDVFAQNSNQRSVLLLLCRWSFRSSTFRVPFTAVPMAHGAGKMSGQDDRTPPPQISPTRYKMMVTERFIKTIPLRDDREHRWTTPLDQENAHRTEEHVSGKICPAVHVETNTPILTHSTGRENTREIEADTNTST